MTALLLVLAAPLVALTTYRTLAAEANAWVAILNGDAR